MVSLNISEQAPSDRTAYALELLYRKIDELASRSITRMPSERQLSSEFRVSRRVIRQALDVLEAEGRVHRAQGRGTSILKTIEPHLTRVEPDHASDIKRYTSPVEIMEARLVLEPAIAALAAKHASSRDLEDMQNYIDRSRNAQNHRVWEKWDGALHKAISRSTNNMLLIRFCELLDDARAQTAWGQLRKASLNSERQKAYTRQHEAILAAIANRDAEQAALAMKRHLITVKRTLVDQIDDISLSDD